MADKHQYYYMRLKENYFDTDQLQILESMQDGYLYSNILLKMYLKSLKNDGRLFFNDYIPYNPQMIATITRHNVGTVEKALDIFKKLGFIEVLDNGAIYMLDIQNFIGKTTTEADRQREYDRRISSEKAESRNLEEIRKKTLPELEIEKELKKEIKKDIVEQATTAYPFSEIIDYLNAKAGTMFKATTAETKRHIKARIDDGYTLDDFKAVIDDKCNDWLKDKEWKQYIRPSTLFAPTNFENYLNKAKANNVVGKFSGVDDLIT